MPAVGQGALCVQTRADDVEARALAEKISCIKTSLCIAMERAFLGGLDGSFRTPIAGLAVVEGDEIWFRGELLSLDGAERFSVERRLSIDANKIGAAELAGADAAAEIRAAAGGSFLHRLSLT